MIRAILILAATFGLAACVGSSGGAVLAGLDTGDAAVAVTRYRAANGLGPVKLDPALNRAARIQAEAMARAATMSHDIAGDFGARVRATGAWGHAAENLGMGYASLSSAMTGWHNSTGHRKNLLLPDATRIGVASARDADRRLYWALIIASPEEKTTVVSAGPVVALPILDISFKQGR